MSTWTLIQIVFDLFMACGIFVVVMRMNRAPKDDPRLSRGLALLQSKISVLEDLSDRTEAQVASLISVLESKSREVQAKVELADRHVAEIRVAMDRSLEVASIFQDKIPHKEIIERQNTIKYVQAARLSHAGVSIDEIAKRVDLPRGELEFIASVNRERLMFSEDELPEWAREATPDASGARTVFANAVNGLAFDESASASSSAQAAAPAPAPAFVEETMSNEERARRLRAEIELSENQRLVENLSRLQAEMQNLDQQLAREANPRAVAAAYEVPRVETDHLKKLGDEFRRAVREGERADNAQPFGASGSLPPLEKLSQLIPAILDGGEQTSAVAPIAQAKAVAPPRPTPVAAPVAAAAPPAPAAAATSTVAAAPQDPVLARAVAQAKVQAALRSSAKHAPIAATSPNPELQRARAVARDLAGNPVPPAKPGEVRKVAFPRIDGSDF